MQKAEETDNKIAIGLTDLLTLIALLLNLPKDVTTLAHEVIAVSLVSTSAMTLRTYQEAHTFDLYQLIMCTVVQLFLICYRLYQFSSSKGHFAACNDFKKLDPWT